MMYYLHSVPGQLRMKSPFIKGNQRGASRVQKLLRGIPGIESRSVSTVTGSLVVYYDPALVCPGPSPGCSLRRGILKPRGPSATTSASLP